MRRAMRLAVPFLCACLFLFSLTSCTAGGRSSRPITRTYYGYFDTVTTVSAYGERDAERFATVAEAVRAMLAEYHKLFDIYHAYEGVANLYTLNERAGEGPIALDARLIDFLLYAKEVYQLTEGRVNIVMGSVLSLWHDCRAEAVGGGTARVPDSEALSAAREHTDIDALVIDREAGTAYLSDPMARLDVGALGKGYAVERVTERLGTMGLSGYVLDVGGNLRILGAKPNGEPFTTGVRDPEDRDTYIKILKLTDTACVTSGDYERYYTVGGVRYHHIIDPATAYPAAYVRSVTVVTPDSGLADALSTALFCMPPEEAVNFVASLDGVRAILIDADGRVYDTAENK